MIINLTSYHLVSVYYQIVRSFSSRLLLGSATLLFDNHYLGSSRFRVVEFRGRQDSGSSRFEVIEIWGCRDSGLSRFGVVEIQGRRDSGSSRFGVVKLRGWSRVEVIKIWG